MVQDNDDIIELTDLVEEGSSQEKDQEIIELTDMAPPNEAGPSGDDALDIEGQGDDLEIGPEEELSLDGDLDDKMTVSDTPGPEGVPETPVAEVAGVGQADIEAALERVIEKKFSQTIETILFEVMERVIQKEIVDIKAGLQKDLDDIGKA